MNYGQNSDVADEHVSQGKTVWNFPAGIYCSVSGGLWNSAVMEGSWRTLGKSLRGVVMWDELDSTEYGEMKQ